MDTSDGVEIAKSMLRKKTIKLPSPNYDDWTLKVLKVSRLGLKAKKGNFFECNHGDLTTLDENSASQLIFKEQGTSSQYQIAADSRTEPPP